MFWVFIAVFIALSFTVFLFLRAHPPTEDAKILVVVEDQQEAIQVRAKLNTIGYAFYNTYAPSSRGQAVLNAQQPHWPVFFVTTAVFSGSVFGKMDMAFVFKEKENFVEALSLERQMALEHCVQSFEVFPESEDGLLQSTEQYATLKACFPIRI